ncbi:hypothetical protein FV139_19585 [Parahaliea maris]|uniref:Uncharacterized protein n=1 Tax=Parahaliea maris TaxID=2716870 RepID=A0A5C8ZP01_9GAMM|nr:hypothetical protein [Parahaliea maris]TXS89494.1 hypothetical protein FV139_19585 [Parahaliea maris]
MRAKFSGNPARYRLASTVISAYSVLSVYAAFALIKWGLQDETWVFGWKPLLIVAVLIPLYARFCYRWMMRTDAQYGSGSSWQLVATKVKLPEFNPRKKKAPSQ